MAGLSGKGQGRAGTGKATTEAAPMKLWMACQENHVLFEGDLEYVSKEKIPVT